MQLFDGFGLGDVLGRFPAGVHITNPIDPVHEPALVLSTGFLGLRTL